MKLNNLLESLPDYYSSVDRESITRAYHFAEQAHQGQKRISGEPFVSHCLAVATIIADLHIPPVVVIAGLLHDTVEDTPVTLDTIRREFGDDVVRLVDGVTKLSHLPNVIKDDQLSILTEDQPDGSNNGKQKPSDNGVEIAAPRSRKKELESETLRKTFMAMGEDIRIVLIKLADRLHNMRTLGYLEESKRIRIAQETLDIFAPLANRLGIWQIKWELEDLAFRYVNPEKYKEIAENLAERRGDREYQIQEIIKRLEGILVQAGIQAEISGRPKHIYSIYRKMVDKGKSFEMVRDLRGVRLIVADIPSCYAALGVIHTNWKPIPHEFDDYIAGPKDNLYQSLHTAVIYDDGKPVEIQIRTPEMDQNAELGIAAHWRYKEGTPRDVNYEQRVNWLRRLMDWRHDVEDAQEFVDGMKTELFQDRVYVFTPRGDIIDLPAGSTPIDFAYHVHTEIGHRCRGAKINGKLVTLDYTLKTGDQVEVLTAKQGGPSRDWLNTNLGMVRTQRARSKIKAWFKWQDHEQNLTQGKMLLDREFRRLGLVDIDLEKIAREFDYHTTEDLYIGLGCGDLNVSRIINKLSEVDKEQIDALFTVKPAGENIISKDSVMVLGLKGLLTTTARCCKPVPGDDIVGYITRGRGATIHRQDCPNMLRLKDHERIVKVSWGEPKNTYPVRVQIKAYDRQGLMVDISNILNNESVSLQDVDLKVHHNLAVINLVLEVGDIIQLSRILTKIENLQNVMQAMRLRPG
jgi:GTP diphosphokinase / guanosine-3',5'-bis(diphosphate) 3'-diphosphatase